jgi:hypothetical protein
MKQQAVIGCLKISNSCAVHGRQHDNSLILRYCYTNAAMEEGGCLEKIGFNSHAGAAVGSPWRVRLR